MWTNCLHGHFGQDQLQGSFGMDRMFPWMFCARPHVCWPTILAIHPFISDWFIHSFKLLITACLLYSWYYVKSSVYRREQNRPDFCCYWTSWQTNTTEHLTQLMDESQEHRIRWTGCLNTGVSFAIKDVISMCSRDIQPRLGKYQSLPKGSNIVAKALIFREWER